MIVQPYLFFEGQCEAALSFYLKVLNAETIELLRYKDCPEQLPPDMLPPNCDDKIMHASFKIGDAIILASDGTCGGESKMQGASLAISFADTSSAQSVFNQLAENGTVEIPFEKTFFSPGFGSVRDQFGISWMTVTEEEK